MRNLISQALYPVFWVLSFPVFSPYLRVLHQFVIKTLGVNNAYMHDSGITVGEWKLLRQMLPLWESAPCILDVGFNAGDYSLAVRRLRPDARIYGFEPNPQLTVKAPVVSPPFELFPQAASDRDGAAVLFDVPGGAGTCLGTLHPEHLESWGHHQHSRWQVLTVRLDTFLAQRDIGQVNLLKIDTEGHDIAVLRGVKQFLDRGAIEVIQFEFVGVNARLRIFVADFFEILSPAYDLFRLNVGGRLLPLPEYSPLLEIFGSQNFIAIRRDAAIRSRLAPRA